MPQTHHDPSSNNSDSGVCSSHLEHLIVSINATHSFANEQMLYSLILDTCYLCISMTNRSFDNHQGFDTLYFAFDLIRNAYHWD
jgi:hypothetical protein